MKIEDFCDMQQFDDILHEWSTATGLAVVAIGDEGEYISKYYNYTEFCMELTRKSPEGLKRCQRCDREGKGIYHCHAGLMDFGIPIKLPDGKVVGSVIGGQVLPENPDESKFKRTARELKIDEDIYIEALNKVNIRTKEEIEAAANLLGKVINMFVQTSYVAFQNAGKDAKIENKMRSASEQIDTINKVTKKIEGFGGRQKILALNASIEAARAGEAGRGFAVVAKEVQGLAVNMTSSSEEIKDAVLQLNKIMDEILNS